MRILLFLVSIAVLFDAVETCECWTNFWAGVAERWHILTNSKKNSNSTTPGGKDPNNANSEGTKKPANGGTKTPADSGTKQPDPDEHSDAIFKPVPEAKPTKNPPVALPSPGGDHTILLNVQTAASRIASKQPPKPSSPTFEDIRDDDHVKMPCSKKNQWKDPVSGNMVPRWDKIKQALQGADKWENGDDLKRAIFSYNDQNTWDLNGLGDFFDSHAGYAQHLSIFKMMLAEMAKLALRLPELVRKAIPIVKRGMVHKVSMTQEQAACILANMFFCTFPDRAEAQKNAVNGDLPKANFQDIFLRDPYRPVYREKLNFIFHYFFRILILKRMPIGVVTFERASSVAPDWKTSTKGLTNLRAHPKPGTIEDADLDTIQVDFANKIVGGGVIGRGNVQEEILFLISPETIVSRLFLTSLFDEESIKLIGCERFSNYAGYSRTLKFTTAFVDERPSDGWGRKRVQIVAIDALDFETNKQIPQFDPKTVQRDLRKAYVGFAQPHAAQVRPIATGNWGCGAFKGDPQLKSIIQWLAAAEAGTDVDYYTWGVDDVEGRGGAWSLGQLQEVLKNKNVNVGKLFRLLMDFCNSNPQPKALYGFLQSKLATM